MLKLTFLQMVFKVTFRIFINLMQVFGHVYLPTHLFTTACLWNMAHMLLFAFVFVKCVISSFFYPWDEKRRKNKSHFFITLAVWFNFVFFSYCLFIASLNIFAASLSYGLGAIRAFLFLTYFQLREQDIIPFEANAHFI